MLTMFSFNVVFASDDNIFKTDYENIEIGFKPDYGYEGWDGDNNNVDSKAEVLSLEDGNKAFCLHSTGTGETKSINMLIYKTLKMEKDRDRFFQFKLMTKDTFGTKNVFIRDPGGSKYILFSLPRAKNSIYVVQVRANMRPINVMI